MGERSPMQEEDYPRFFLKGGKRVCGGVCWGNRQVRDQLGLCSGKEGLPFSNGRALWAISSIGRCFRIVVRGVFNMRGRRAGFSLTRRER